MDKLVRTYSCKRKTRRWTMAIFANFIDIACYNAYVIFLSRNQNYHAGRTHKRRLFLEELSLMMIQRSIDERQRQASVSRPPARSLQEPSEKRRRCSLCPRAMDKKTNLTCSQCCNPICNQRTQYKRVSYGCLCTSCRLCYRNQQ